MVYVYYPNIVGISSYFSYIGGKGGGGPGVARETGGNVAGAVGLALSIKSVIKNKTPAVKTLARYLEVIVDPTFDDFDDNRGSIRHAYLASVAIFHAVDRAAEESGKSPASVRQRWCKESLEFKLVDVLAHHFKHVLSSDERIPPGSRPGLPIRLALGFDESGETMDLRNLYYVIRDAVRFVHRIAGTIHPKLP